MSKLPLAIQGLEPNWLIITLSSAVVSAFINLAWNAWSKHSDRKRDDAKEVNRINHVYLDIALRLDHFSCQCSNRLGHIDDAQHAFITREDEDALARLQSVDLRFESEPKWVELPVEFVATVKELIAQFEAAGGWVNDAFQVWADALDASSFEQQRLVFYGRRAAELVKDIRQRIAAGQGDTDVYLAAFNSALDTYRAQHMKEPAATMLPELKAMFVTPTAQ